MKIEDIDPEWIIEIAMSCGYRISPDPLKQACIELMLVKFAYTIARLVTETDGDEERRIDYKPSEDSNELN